MKDFWKKRGTNIFLGGLEPPHGSLGEILRKQGAEVVIGHPTFKNARTIGRQLADGIRGALKNFVGKKVAFVVSDTTYTRTNPDPSTLEAAIQGAKDAMGEGGVGEVLVVVTPFQGYQGNYTLGKGSALKLIYEELAFCNAKILILLDGDLRNDMAEWQRVFKAVAENHYREHGDKEFFVTARYARHFVDASLSRFVVGPLTTLMGTFVAGGISGDICLSANLAEQERGPWTEERRKYGTDIATTFNNIANPKTLIYEAYLGAKLHEVTDQAKLEVMPGEVIGSALERLLHYRDRVREILAAEAGLKRPIAWGPEQTGIGFIDPGYTDAFRVKEKVGSLVKKWPEFREDVQQLLGERAARELASKVAALRKLKDACRGHLRFLNLTRPKWIEALYQGVAKVLHTGEVQTVKRALNFLYTATFLEFCRERLKDLGLTRYEEVVAVEDHLGVPLDRAKEFYDKKVDGEALRLAEEFFARRKRILRILKKGE